MSTAAAVARPGSDLARTFLALLFLALGLGLAFGPGPLREAAPVTGEVGEGLRR